MLIHYYTILIMSTVVVHDINPAIAGLFLYMIHAMNKYFI